MLIPTRTTESLAWMRFDVGVRLIPFGLVVLAVWLAARPSWLGLTAGDVRVQLTFGLGGAVLMFAATSLGQLWITRRVRGTVKVPAEALTIGAAVGSAKVAAIRAALRGKLINGLITDEATASAILNQ